jgi:hypothetical protein
VRSDKISLNRLQPRCRKAELGTFPAASVTTGTRALYGRGLVLKVTMEGATVRANHFIKQNHQACKEANDRCNSLFQNALYALFNTAHSHCWIRTLIISLLVS